MQKMYDKAYAKINLTLDVIGVREDGYHLLRSVMQTTAMYDKLTLQKTAGEGIRFETNLPYIPADENNLAVRAAKALLESEGCQEGLSILLEKFIPVAAGLAGGSTDAAAVLCGVNELFRFGKTKEELMALGVSLGADVPYCILGGTALAEGIGEVLTPLPDMPPCHILLAKPPFSVSTKEIFARLPMDEATPHPDVDAMLRAIEAEDLSCICKAMGNTLASVTEELHPEIAMLREEMLTAGAMNAMMSGSGPTVFGIFTDEDVAMRCRDAMREKYPRTRVFLTRPLARREK